MSTAQGPASGNGVFFFGSTASVEVQVPNGLPSIDPNAGPYPDPQAATYTNVSAGTTTVAGAIQKTVVGVKFALPA